MGYNLKLVIRNKYEQTILDLVQLSSQIEMGSIKNDIKIVEGNKLRGGVQGVGMIDIGRKMSFGIPIYEYRNASREWVRLDEQYSKYTSMIMSTNSKQYFLRLEYDGEIYEAEHALIEVGGYTVKYINDLGVITISLTAIDKVFLRQLTDIYDVALNENADGMQDIMYYSKNLVPTALKFAIDFNVLTEQLTFIVANRLNFGIYFNSRVSKGHKLVYFDGDVLTINGVVYDHEGISPELNPGLNVIYLEYSEPIERLRFEYKRGILI